MSRWLETTPEGTVYEGMGLFPTVPVWIAAADATENRDDHGRTSPPVIVTLGRSGG